MAEDDTEKTEDPSQKKLDQALEQGDVVKSQEVNTWFMLAASTLALMSFSGSLSHGLSTTMRGLIANSYSIAVDGHALVELFRKIMVEVGGACAMSFLVFVIAAVAGNMLQHRLVWSTEGLMPKFSKISPMAGFKRMFGTQAWVNFGKGLIKLVLIGTVLSMLMWPRRTEMESLISTDPVVLLPYTRSLSLSMFGYVVAIMAVIAAADYLFMYMTWMQRQRMSLQELKEEYKQSEGDPIVKGKIRQLRQQRARQRMMQDVPKASVIITNPTHYAIALQYDQGMGAPICVAKGMDNIALKIREIAGKHDIPIMENPPLARALHATVDVGQEIPPDHYKAVAEIIGIVMKLRRGRR
ncbi:MAG: flagellar biosynthetic protein FlhB [Xanthobacteraceae bacterium]|nr:flagellar biosynthetic protein FlhB [Xanthobacteraceae bacterium]